MRAHVTLWYEWDVLGAEARARRALELAPGMHLAHDCIGFVLAAQGRFEEAIAAMQRARALDPLSDYATYDLAWILILAGRWEQATRELQPAVARHPQSSELRRAFGFCLFYAGRLREARAEFERVLEINVGDRWGSTNLVQALAALGETAEARRLVREIEERAPHEPIPALGIAIMHHWLGDDNAALRWLERSLDVRDYWLVMMRFDPSMMRLRGNPRFESLLQRVRATT
jgi:Flp pilus assembly protein TadD